MILANAAWGQLLADQRVPGIYRSQQAGGRVRMSTQPLPHHGLGVAQYGWSTSPLRRYTDLVNQRQLIAVVSAQEPPYAAGDAELFAVISAFDARYTAYAEFQQRMERYWCLRWIAQQAQPRLKAVVVRDELIRLAEAPLYLRMPELPAMGLSPGQPIIVDITALDELELSVSARFVSVAQAAAGDDNAMVELEDPIDGIDEVPGPPQAEADDAALAQTDAAAVPGMAPAATPPVSSET
jgi:exoribonuclease-2